MKKINGYFENNIDMNLNDTLQKLKSTFSTENLKEMSFCFDSEFDNMKAVIENIIDQIENTTEIEKLEKYREIFIDSFTEKLNEYLTGSFEYYETEDWGSEYFNEMPNDEIQIKGTDYYGDKKDIKNNVISLLENLSIGIIDYMEFSFNNPGFVHFNPENDIYFSQGNLGEFETQIDDDMSTELKKLSDEDKEEIKSNLDFYTSDFELFYSNVSYAYYIYSISFNDFFSNVLDCIAFEDNKEEIAILYNLYRSVKNDYAIETEIAKKIIDLYYCEEISKRDFQNIIKENDFILSENKKQYCKTSNNKKIEAVLFTTRLKLVNSFPFYFDCHYINKEKEFKSWMIKDKKDFIDYIKIFNELD